MNVVLIGFMGTGKTEIGRSLARQLNKVFIDTDSEIVSQENNPIPQIFSERGEVAFRRIETDILQCLVLKYSKKNDSIVLATGGGLPLVEENRELLHQIGTVVWLKARPQQILQRVGKNLHLRPMFHGYEDKPFERIKSLLENRTPFYEAASDLVWDTTKYRSPDAAAASLAQYLCQTTVKSQKVSVQTK